MTHSSFEKKKLSCEETAEIVNSLHIHQIELELQNEELRNTQCVLEEAQERYSTLYNFAPVGYVTLDDRGIIREANLTILEMLKLEKRAFIGQPFCDFVLSENQDTFYLHQKNLRQSTTRVRCELQLKNSDGVPFWAALESVVTRPRLEGRGASVEFRCIVSDISESRAYREALLTAREELEKRVAQRTEALEAANEALVREIREHKRTESERLTLERQILQAQKMESLGVLAGGIAHDFNNLLMGILGFADLALLGTDLNPKAASYVRKMKETARCLSNLTNQLLAYSGKGRFLVERLNMALIVEEMQSLLAFPVAQNIDVEYTLERDLPFFEGDRNQQCQVLMNLVTNAAEAIGDNKGTISVSCGVVEATREDLSRAVVDDKLPAGSYVYLQVSDTGCGMDQETRERIFEPFFTTKFSGRGLGLAALLGIVRSHKGALFMESRAGVGTMFRVLYPCMESERPNLKTARVSSVPPPQKRCTVLVVDDEEIARDVGAQYLECIGIDVLIAQNGTDALEIFRKKNAEVDCVLLDLSMPGMNGMETYREMRRIKEDVCVILSSGYSEYELKARFGETGISGFLPKPYDLETFSKKINLALFRQLPTVVA